MVKLTIGRYILTITPDLYSDGIGWQEKEANKEKCSQTILKYLVLISLTIQNAAYILIFKYALMQDEIFITSTAICLSEVLKVIFSFILMLVLEKSWNKVMKMFYNSVMKTPMDTLNMLIPAIAYVIMNNLMYISGVHLDVITFQIISQLKIPMTVIFSMILLRSTYRRLQYLSLVILTAGVIIVVQFTDVKEKKSKPGDKTIGYITGVIASLLSGFAGVYFERILKTTTLSVWARNLQLSLISVPAAFLSTYTYDYGNVKDKGFFFGYNYIVWLIVIMQASGGLTVALSVKLTDNVSKGYATAASIIMSGYISTIIFHYRFNYLYACGAALVILSIPLYTFSFSLSNNILPQKIDYEGKECYI